MLCRLALPTECSALGLWEQSRHGKAVRRLGATCMAANSVWAYGREAQGQSGDAV